MPSTQTTSYLVCATPRSGSSLLCGLLAGTGVAGRPEEYFWRGDEGSWSQRWGVSGFADYLRAAIAHGSTPNGVFGAKVMYGYLPDLLGSLVELPGGRGLDDRSLLERVFPNLCCLWIWREDVVAQAVSWSKALQTNVWSVGDERAPAATPPRFDFEQIHELVGRAVAGRVGWQRWFRAHDIEPLAIRYEDLAADMPGATRRALRSSGPRPPPAFGSRSPPPGRPMPSTDSGPRYRRLLADPQRR
jgi:trehalose 2-sulfotransferase